ncbi:MAG: hypothetical protein RJA44_2767 [Pseudomonadota bacterium]
MRHLASHRARLGMLLPVLLAGSALMLGGWLYGWRGLVLGLTLVVFWLVLQFNRSLRVLQQVGQRPVGQVDSVAMLLRRLEHGMQMSELLTLTGCLGQRRGSLDDWQWQDSYGHTLVVSLRRGVVVRWAVAQADEPDEADAAPPSAD